MTRKRPRSRPPLPQSHGEQKSRRRRSALSLWTAAIVSISASDCRIDATIHESLAIDVSDAQSALVLGEAARQRPQERDAFAQTPAAGP